MICVHIPQIGDKFCSRHIHKGILGMAYTKEDMHLIVEEIVSIIVVSPHDIPF